MEDESIDGVAAPSNDVYDPSEVEKFFNENKSTQTKRSKSMKSVICLEDDDEDEVNKKNAGNFVSEVHYIEDYIVQEVPNDAPVAVPELPHSKISVSENDDDVSIVYEKVIPFSEVQVINREEKVRKTTKGRKRPFLGDESSRPCCRSSSIPDHVLPAVEPDPLSSQNSLDDSVCIVGEYSAPTFPPPEPSNTTLAKEKDQIDNHRSSPDLSGEEKLKVMCSVCFDGQKELLSSKRVFVVTICGHVFCNECIKSAIKINKMCPKCRKRLNLKQFHPIYL